MNVQFQEADTSVSEDEAFLKLSVTMDDSLDADVTVEIVPKTIQQYIASGGKLPRDLQNIDPAEEGSPIMIALSFCPFFLIDCPTH